MGLRWEGLVSIVKAEGEACAGAGGMPLEEFLESDARE
jgi:hypothetical protein